MSEQSADKSKNDDDRIVDIHLEIDIACTRFEENWRRNNGAYQIEEFLSAFAADQSTKLNPVGSAVTIKIIEELIFLEVDLRFDDGQKLDRDEYYIRFPDFELAVNQAIQRIENLDSTTRLAEDQMLSLTAPFKGDWKSVVVADMDGVSVVPDKLGPFDELTKIGSGGFGVVYRAIDTRTDKFVALKFPRKKANVTGDVLHLVFEETKKSIDLDHPGIVKTLSMEALDRYVFIVQEYVDGTDLKSKINHPRSQEEIVDLVSEMAEALAYAHQQRIVHRDLKPANILLNDHGKPLVTDFGLAFHESVQLDLPNQICGTVPYMSPQLAAGLTRNLDGRTDIWSLGIIFYELLTGIRPFRGNTNEEILAQIETRDPKPLREIDPRIDKELERICLKCLERRARDRYAVGDDLADDLRHWAIHQKEKLKNSSNDIREISETKVKTQLVPPGLRAYGTEDANFFLELLPGPRDRNDVPSSIRFWKVRICASDSLDHQVPVGVIYGPSGSGKSSFVKAGLLPQLNKELCAVYVEATLADTEVRIIKSLRQRFPYIPEDISLPGIFSGLSKSLWQSFGQKILLVLDQFEQWLVEEDVYEQSQLAKALRHCDGDRLQCLILVRDDFWLSLSRFVDALEMDLLEGHNSQGIDLFGREHAKKVLKRLGQAYGKLPVSNDQLSEDQQLFIDEAIDQLANANYVICVRLTLFAEMFKNRPWSIAELDSVHGAHGVGEQFMEETFNSTNSPKRYRTHAKAVREILKLLLPEAGTNIRGLMKTKQEILEASGYGDGTFQFESLLRILDSDLRMITQVAPDASNATDSQIDSNRGTNANRFYQLTHDYLVPSIRKWITTGLRQTRRGRAQLRLKELAAQVVPGQPPKYLPSTMEWLSWQLLISKKSLARNENAVMQASSRRFIRQSAVGLFVIVVVASIFAGLILSQNRKSRSDIVDGLIDRLLHQELIATPQLANKIQDYPEIQEKLGLIIDGIERHDDDSFRARLGQLIFDKTQVGEVAKNIIQPKITPEELRILLEYMISTGGDQEEIADVYTSVLNQPKVNTKTRLRAACALSFMGKKLDWSGESDFIIAQILDEPATSLDNWLSLIGPIADDLRPMCVTIFDKSDDIRIGSKLARILVYISPKNKEKRATFLVKQILDDHDIKFDTLLTEIENDDGKDKIADKIAAEFAIEQQQTSNFVNNWGDEPLDGDVESDKAVARSTEAMRRTAASVVALLRLGRRKPIVQILSNAKRNSERAFVIEFLKPVRIRFDHIRELYESPQSSSPSLRRSILMAFSTHAEDLVARSDVEWLEGTASDHFISEEDSGCHSAAQLILNKLGSVSLLDRKKKWIANHRKSTSAGAVRHGKVLINNQLQTFAVIKIDSESSSSKTLAVMTTEVTNRDIHAFIAKSESGKAFDIDLVPDEKPFVVKDLFLVCKYCDWLSELENLPESEWCYRDIKAENDLLRFKIPKRKQGYRLPSEFEWIEALRARTTSKHFFGETTDLACNYAWIRETFVRKKVANTAPQTIGLLFPNDYGIFDIYGNCYEVCEANGLYLQKGLETRAMAAALSANAKFPYDIGSQNGTLLGVRLVRLIND